tara:strand:+ start:423 stop:590 length:168 start_codon:yes stop_codon:yes gene_type:complete
VCGVICVDGSRIEEIALGSIAASVCTYEADLRQKCTIFQPKARIALSFDADYSSV